MMESCRGVSSSLQRSRYISWCLDPAESQTPVTTALTAAASPQKTSHQNHQTARSVPLLLLSPPETNTMFSHQHSQPVFTDRKLQQTITPSHHSQLNLHSSSALHNTDKTHSSHAETEEVRLPEVDSRDREDREDPSLLHPRDTRLFLPRSSPVICRRHRPISWHGGGSDVSAPSSSDSSSPGSGSLSPDQRESKTATSAEDLGSKPSSGHHSSKSKKDQKPRSASASSNLQRFLHAALHLPFSGQQGLSEERRGRSHTSFVPGSSGRPTSKHLPESSADIFKTSCELEKENAHFVVVDMVLMVLEGVKSTQSFNRWTTTMDSQSGTSTHTCSDLTQEDNTHRLDTSHSSYADIHQHTQDEDEEEEEDDKARHQPKTLSVLSTDSGFEDCRTEATLTHADSLRDAESLAQQLVLEFKRRWLPSHELQRGRLSLRSSLQELPGTGAVTGSSGSLTEEIRLRTRMRGSLSWAPPRFQIIFTVQPNHRRSEVVALQHFLCAGCGTEVEPKYIKKLRYCEYLGRYFCDCCHSGAEAVIPARVLSSWDFSRYPVSDFSNQLLDSVWHQPLFDLTCVGKTLYSKVKELDKFRELQDQLLSIKKLLSACRLSESVMEECAQLPAHLMKQPHLFSMDDLLRVKKGQLVVQVKAVLHAAIAHVEKCELCLGRGFICEFCREKDVIFPFQSDICRRCPVCGACFHKNCFVEKKCPKCARICSRKKAHANP